ncbi:MAG: GDP-mannose 4,6-dehydratase [Planctomycetota bacterium]
MRYFITGGCGFIGSHLADKILEEKNSKVLVLDNLTTGSIRNIEHLKGNPNFKYDIDTIFNESKVAEYVDWADIVIHLAASVGVRKIVENPVETIENNVHGTENILKHTAKKGRPIFIASTSEVYGKATKIPFREDDDIVLGPTIKSRWSYACSKAIDEFLALSYFKEKKLPVVIGRLFNTVGPRQVGHYGMVIPRFVSQALKGEDITVYGDGRQSRCFCSVKDVVEAILKLIHNPNCYGQIYNIGSDEEITILELAKKVKEKAHSQSKIVFIDYAKAYAEGFEDLGRRVPDISKIRKAIGFERKYNLDDILTEIIEYQRRELIR